MELCSSCQAFTLSGFQANSGLLSGTRPLVSRKSSPQLTLPREKKQSHQILCCLVALPLIAAPHPPARAPAPPSPPEGRHEYSKSGIQSKAGFEAKAFLSLGLPTVCKECR